MNFKQLIQWFIFTSLIILLSACSNEDKETELVDLHTTAAEDVISIQFPANTETVVSINSTTALSIQGLKHNGVDSVNLTSQIEWSLSNGTLSTIDKHGHLKAGPTAETITVYAKLGILSSSIDIRVSAARFDQVVSLKNPEDTQAISIEMCQSQTITPYGKYIDDSGNEEIRKVDNTVIGNIDWTITPSQNAYIETAGNTTTLYGLASGDLKIQAKATSAYSGNQVTSAELSQTIGNGLDSIKICSSNATDYAGCNLTSASVEQDQQVSFIAIGHYNSGGYRNISRTSKWGISNTNVSAAISDMQQIDVTGKVESTSSTLSLACGDINQTITGDITQGIILNEAVGCNTSNCKSASADISINELKVTSFEVTANGNPLTSAQTFTLDSLPSNKEIVLKVSVILSNSSNADVITDNENLSYVIDNIDGNVVIEKTDTPGTFSVVNAGIAQVQLTYLKGSFTVRINITDPLQGF